GGSPTGALFLDEPGFPKDVGRSLLTVEWGRNAINRHPLKPNGASFTIEQHQFIGMSRPTGITVDGESRLYIASWRGASYTYAGPNVGYVIRVTHPASRDRVAPFPDLTTAGDAELLKHLMVLSHTRRLHTRSEER